MKNTIEVNKLKKKLHLKKLIDFLKLYKYVVFYQSHKINIKNGFIYGKTHPGGQEANKQFAVLFLVKCARLRKLLILKCAQLLVNEKKNKYEKGGPKSHINTGYAGLKTRFALNHSSSEEPEPLHLLRLFTKPLFNTTLVGCDSLESMQRCIRENLTDSSIGTQDSSCLGGIYNNSYIDKADCFTLAQLNAQSVHLELTNKLSQGTQLLLKQLSWPKLNLNSTLNIKAGHLKS